MRNEEIIAIPRIADLLIDGNYAVLGGQIDRAKDRASVALDIVHVVWGTTPINPIGQVQVWAIQALWVSINAAE